MQKTTKMYMQFCKFMNKNSYPSAPPRRSFKSRVLRLIFIKTAFYRIILDL